MCSVWRKGLPAHAVVLPKGVSTFFVKIGFISQRGGAQPIPQIHTAVLIHARHHLEKKSTRSRPLALLSALNRPHRLPAALNNTKG